MIKIIKKKNPKYKSTYDDLFLEFIKNSIKFGNSETLFKALNRYKIGDVCADCKERYFACYCEGDLESTLNTFGIPSTDLKNENKISEYALKFAINNISIRKLEELYFLLQDDLTIQDKKCIKIKEDSKFYKNLEDHWYRCESTLQRLRHATKLIKKSL